MKKWANHAVEPTRQKRRAVHGGRYRAKISLAHLAG